MDAEISAALRADIEIVLHILHIDGLSALVAFAPHPLGNIGLSPSLGLKFRINLGICFFKHIPQHGYYLPFCALNLPPLPGVGWKMSFNKSGIRISLAEGVVLQNLVLEIYVCIDSLNHQLA